MNSETLYRYYKGYIEDANDLMMLEDLKHDITTAANSKILDAVHYAKLIRLIAKKKKENKISEVA